MPILIEVEGKLIIVDSALGDLVPYGPISTNWIVWNRTRKNNVFHFVKDGGHHKPLIFNTEFATIAFIALIKAALEKAHAQHSPHNHRN